MSQILKSKIDLLEKLKSLHAYNFDNDPLKAALLFRTLLYIDSLHDFTNKDRLKPDPKPGKGKTKIPKIPDPKPIELAGRMLTRLTYKFKEECYNLIKQYIDTTQYPELDKFKEIFNSEYNIEFVYPDVGGNKKVKPTKEQNDINLKSIKKTATKLAECGTIFLYEKKNELTLLFQYTKLAQTGIKKMDLYNENINKEIKDNHKSYEKNNVYFIISIAKLLYDINEKISLFEQNNTCSISPDYLHTYSDIIIQLFGLVPINYIEKDNPKSNITTLGFIHGLLCIKHNKYEKNFSQHESCTFKGDTAYLPNLIFTVDAEGSSKSTNYLTELSKMYTEYQKQANSKKKVHLIKTKATDFDGASETKFKNIHSITDPIPLIHNNTLPENYDLNITFKCGEIKLMQIEYSKKTTLTITQWFGKKVGKFKNVSGEFTLNMAVKDFIDNEKDPLNIYNLYFKTICDLGQILAFIAFEKYLASLDPTITNHYLFGFHTLDRFCGQIGSLLHPGIVIENQSIKNITKEFPNTIYISTSKIKDEDGKRISDYDINWHTLFPGETFTKENLYANKAEMDQLFKESKNDFEKRIKQLEEDNKQEIIDARQQLEDEVSYAINEEKQKERQQMKDEVNHAYTMGKRDAHEERDEELLKIKELDRKKDKSLERHRQEEQERIKDRKSLERHRREEEQRIKDRKSLERHRREEKQRIKDTSRKRRKSSSSSESQAKISKNTKRKRKRERKRRTSSSSSDSQEDLHKSKKSKRALGKKTRKKSKK